MPGTFKIPGIFMNLALFCLRQNYYTSVFFYVNMYLNPCAIFQNQIITRRESMWRKVLSIFLLTFFLTACQKTPPTSTSISSKPEIPSGGANYLAYWQADALKASQNPFVDVPLPQERGALFSGSGACAACHRNMKDEAGNDVSIDSMWRSTLLANAARDPYWRATVRSEVNQAPQIAEVIQKKCATCHMPMAEVTLVQNQQSVTLVDQGLFDPANELNLLGNDGISCTLCHQIEPDDLKNIESFSGGFMIDTQLAQGQRLSYGPYEIEQSQVAVMQAASGYIPQLGAHLAQSEACGNCHDLYTAYLDAKGQIAGEFAEQLMYSEWANSAYAETQTCQSCHMPQTQGGVKLAITGGPLRQPFSQHTLVGGNAYMARLLQQNGEELQVSANPDQFLATIQKTINQISTQTARLMLQQTRVENGQLFGEILVENLAGHKFPSGFPSRRAWLHIRVLDKDGNLVFESGAVSEDGAIIGNDNDSDPAQYEPHYEILSLPDQVQIYEGIIVNSDSKVTTTLLRAASYIKDNRLLPAGFQANSQIPALSPAGEAAGDSNFTGGSDRISLQIDVSQWQGPFTLDVNLLYQAIGYRWAENLILEPGAEVNQFAGFYAATPNLPLTVANAQATITP
jgi:hypothetical protein